jgi:hypothetical protein
VQRLTGSSSVPGERYRDSSARPRGLAARFCAPPGYKLCATEGNGLTLAEMRPFLMTKGLEPKASCPHALKCEARKGNHHSTLLAPSIP